MASAVSKTAYRKIKSVSDETTAPASPEARPLKRPTPKNVKTYKTIHETTPHKRAFKAVLTIYFIITQRVCANEGSNFRPLRCQRSALPLSYGRDKVSKTITKTSKMG